MVIIREALEAFLATGLATGLSDGRETGGAMANDDERGSFSIGLT